MNKRDNNNFSVRKRLIGFKYAFNGIVYLIKSQHNAWIHLSAAAIVIAVGFYYSISISEWILLALTIGMVFTAEAFNTAIETIMDKVSPEYDKTTGRIKDIAAGAVLIAALAALIVGGLIFAPKVMEQFN